MTAAVEQSAADRLAARAELRQAVHQCLGRSDGPRPWLVGEPGTTEAFDAALWRVLGTEVGVTGLLVPEELGGSGATVADLAVVAEELGAALSPVPFLSTTGLATTALLGRGDDPVARELLAGIARADITATLAFCDDDGRWEVDAARVRAERVGPDWRLTGRAGFVVDGDSADVVLVPARTDTGVGLFAVDATQVRRHRLRTLDLVRPLATVVLDAAVARPVGPGCGAEPALRAAVDLALVLVAVEQVGGAQRCLDEAVSHAKQRVQFDRPIGSFQAIKHTLVDVLLAVEMARSVAAVAVTAADAHLAAPTPVTARGLTGAASTAKSRCAEAYLHTAEETLHVHGGTGFTWEHDAHLHYRRAKAGQLFLGTPDQHRDRLASCVGL